MVVTYLCLPSPSAWGGGGGLSNQSALGSIFNQQLKILTKARHVCDIGSAQDHTHVGDLPPPPTTVGLSHRHKTIINLGGPVHCLSFFLECGHLSGLKWCITSSTEVIWHAVTCRSWSTTTKWRLHLYLGRWLNFTVISINIEILSAIDRTELQLAS